MKRFLLPILTGVAAVAAHAQESDSVRMYRLQQIEVTATRATLRTPVAYTDLSHDAIARNSYGTDIPTVLALTPSMIATNETGIGIGGTSIRLRGTDATRLNVTINGVAMNNPDSHSMYWYDTPDLISAVGTMQVQRGAGLSTNGTGAFGGAVNMTTGALSTEFSGEASLSYGSYNTNKQAVGISSGLLGGHWAVDARLTHIGSDGYIDRGATDLKSYLFQGGYYNGRTMVKLLSFGGKAKTYLTYNGVTMEDMEPPLPRQRPVPDLGRPARTGRRIARRLLRRPDGQLSANQQPAHPEPPFQRPLGAQRYGLLHLRLRLQQAVQGRRGTGGIRQSRHRNPGGRPDPREDHAQPPGRAQRLGLLHLACARPQLRRFVELLHLPALGRAGLGGRHGCRGDRRPLVRQRRRQAGRQPLRTRQLAGGARAAALRRHPVPLRPLRSVGNQRQLHRSGGDADAAYRRG